MSYTKRTCHKCGYRDIQPNMKSKVIEVETGSSKDDGSWATYFAATFANDKAAQRKMNRTTWANNKRKYTRKKTVWECKSNCGRKHELEVQTPRKTTRTVKVEKTIDDIEKEIIEAENRKSPELRLAEANARLKELKIIERQYMTPFEKFLHFIKECLIWTMYFAIGFVIVSLIF